MGMSFMLRSSSKAQGNARQYASNEMLDTKSYGFAHDSLLRQQMANQQEEMQLRSRKSYSQGYEDAMQDMERMNRMRNRSMEMMEDTEMRRGRRNQSSYSMYGVDRQHGENPETTDPDTSWQNPEKMGADEHWKQKIGFDTSAYNEMEQLRAEMHEMKQMQKELMKGFASVKNISPQLGELLEKSSEVISNPPKTWPPYLERGDIHGIVKMEGEELLKAVKDKKEAKDICKELTHTLAAIMLLVSE